MHFHRTEPYYIPLACNVFHFCIFLYAKLMKILQIEFCLFFAQTFAEYTKEVRNPWNDYVIQPLWAHTHTIRKIIQVSYYFDSWFISVVMHARTHRLGCIKLLFSCMLLKFTCHRNSALPNTTEKDRLCDAIFFFFSIQFWWQINACWLLCQCWQNVEN